MKSVDHNIELTSYGGDTYHNRYSPDSPYKGNDHYKKMKKKCSKCGTTSGQIDIHHKDGNRNNNSRSNLSMMCRSCHRSKHDGKGEMILSSFARIIEDPKTPESEAIAKTHKNSDLMHVEFILCHADINQNQDEFVPEDLEENHSTAVHKPINWSHTDRNIGVIYEAKYIKVNGIAEADKNYYGKIDPLSRDFVACRGVIWEYKHPAEARIMRERYAKSKLFFSMENKFGFAICSECEKEFAFGNGQYCDHLSTRKQTKKSSRKFRDSNFVGAGVIINPGDKDAKTLALAAKDRECLFFEVAHAKSMSTIDINHDLIPYLIRRENTMREIDIPSEIFTQYSGDTIVCADDTNGVFPIDSIENVKSSAKFLLNNALDFYNSNEKLYVIEKLAFAAKEFDVDLAACVEEGDNNVNVDKNSTEFKQAVADAVSAKLSEIESGTKVTELETQLAQANITIEELRTQFQNMTKEKEKAEADFNSFKQEAEKNKIAESRYSDLVEKGYAVKTNADSLKAHLKTLDDNAYAAFVNVLAEAAEAKYKGFEKKEEEKEEDEDKKKKVAKASKEDPVEDSKLAIANKIDTPEKKKSAFDLVLERIN